MSGVKNNRMPQLSRFFGIVIYMYYNEHNPPHFHAKYNEFEALISIDGLSVIQGSLPPRVLGMVMEWAILHSVELLVNWTRAMSFDSLEKIDPLQ